MKGLAMIGKQRAGLSAIALALALPAALSGCVSLGGAEPPPTLFTLTPTAAAPAGLSANGTMAQALAVMEPDAPQRLDVARVPVQVDASTVAYLKDAVWVEKPARLFGRLLAETIRARQTRLVVEGGDTAYAAATRLSGQLGEMGYDASSSSVVVRFDAVLSQPDGQILTRRFEAKVSGVAPDAASVAPALNEAANTVAAEVAEWIG
ncbi:MAG TPA: ABC-type transport auxiliary lipoprotein family protein [Sphingomonadaceae bacterium]|nr:ABC-type transport auxiliary lipoprotein family protein [Sphingomonadaceae bacterium]